MARRIAGILLATLVGVGLTGITACDQSGPADKAAMEKKMKPPSEAVTGAPEQPEGAQKQPTQ